jgi:hypothetical protein
MKPEVLAALIAAGAALAVAVISLINSIILKRVSAETSREMALMKRHFARFDAAQKLADDELKQCLDALDVACVTTQGLKDEIQLFMSNPTVHIQSSDAIQRLGTAALSIGKAFKDELAHMTVCERKVFHRIKNHAHRVVTMTEYLQLPGVTFTNMETLRADLTTIRDQLTEAQRKMIRYRDARIRKRTTQLKTPM